MADGLEEALNLAQRRILEFFRLFPQHRHPDAEKTISLSVLADARLKKPLRVSGYLRIGESS
jgi:hypothetical protein